jgi:DNA-binding NtrC family response regulator
MEPELRILVVDDEERGVELLARTLRKLAVVEVALSGEAAWSRLQEQSFDLVISDQRMPGMQGVELLGRLAEKFPQTGRVLLTGYTDVATTVEAVNRGKIHAYLNKPCPPDQLRMIAASVLERVRLERANGFLLLEVQEKNDELEELVASLRREQRTLVAEARQHARAVEAQLEAARSLLAEAADALASGPPADADGLRALADRLREALPRA